MTNIRDFYLKNFGFLEVKFSIYSNRRVFVMVFTEQMFPEFYWGCAGSMVRIFAERSLARQHNENITI